MGSVGMPNDRSAAVPSGVWYSYESAKEAHVTHSHDDVRLTSLAHCSG